MAINYYQGKPGHGKSYSIVKRVIVPALENGRHVVTNIPLTDACKKLGGSYEVLEKGTNLETVARLLIKGDSEADYEGNPEYVGAVFVLDEFFFLCPAGTRANAIPAVVKAFFAMHRHLSSAKHSTQIVICSQDSSQICAPVKSMVDQSFLVEKTEVGKKALGSLKIYSGCVGVRSGAAKESFVTMKQFTYEPEYFQFYQSQTLGDSDDIGDETKIDDATNLKNNPWFKYGLPFSFIGVPLLIWLAYTQFANLFQGAEPDDDDTLTTQVATPDSSPPSGTPRTTDTLIATPRPEPVPTFQLDRLYLAGLWRWNGYPRYSFVYVPDERSEPVYLTGSELLAEGYQLEIRGKNNVYLHHDNGVKLMAFRRFDVQDDYDDNRRIGGVQNPFQAVTANPQDAPQ